MLKSWSSKQKCLNGKIECMENVVSSFMGTFILKSFRKKIFFFFLQSGVIITDSHFITIAGLSDDFAAIAGLQHIITRRKHEKNDSKLFSKF